MNLLKQQFPRYYTYVLMFNLVMKTGLVPYDWSVGAIKPIYKKKVSYTNIISIHGWADGT